MHWRFNTYAGQLQTLAGTIRRDTEVRSTLTPSEDANLERILESMTFDADELDEFSDSPSRVSG